MQFYSVAFKISSASGHILNCEVIYNLLVYMLT